MEADGQTYAGGWNFGPRDESVMTVERLARGLVEAWGAGEVIVAREANQPHEAGLLKLDCSKALMRLGWHGAWDFPETVGRTAAWYRDYYQGGAAGALTTAQIHAYQAAAASAQLPWTN
jgi:CDP-glucose 4,6-dehydratase